MMQVDVGKYINSGSCSSEKGMHLTHDWLIAQEA